MPNTGLGTPYALTDANIDRIAEQKIGAYALGSVSGDTFTVNYVGRSDDDLNGRLKKWVGKKYTHFKCKHYATKKAAYEKECTMYHDFGGSAGLDNDVHPAKPVGVACSCPVSGCNN